MRGKKPKWQIDLAKKRIEKLFQMAKISFSDNPDKSHRYVYLARKIAMRYNINIPDKYKKSFCRKCNSYLKLGYNSTIRINKKKKLIIIKCGECGNVKRYSLSK